MFRHALISSNRLIQRGFPFFFRTPRGKKKDLIDHRDSWVVKKKKERKRERFWSTHGSPRSIMPSCFINDRPCRDSLNRVTVMNCRNEFRYELSLAVVTVDVTNLLH